MTVNVTDVNEAPVFDDFDDDTTGVQPPPSVLNVIENTIVLRVGADGTTGLGEDVYDAGDNDADQQITGNNSDADNERDAALTLSGADAKYFGITDAGQLSIDQDTNDDGTNDHTVNFEAKSSYSVTIVATSGTGDRTLSTTLDVTVKVIDAEDAGTVTLSQIGPQVGRTCGCDAQRS